MQAQYVLPETLRISQPDNKVRNSYVEISIGLSNALPRGTNLEQLPFVTSAGNRHTPAI